MGHPPPLLADAKHVKQTSSQVENQKRDSAVFKPEKSQWPYEKV